MNKLVFKYLGWILYPEAKQGKEDKHQKMKKTYGSR